MTIKNWQLAIMTISVTLLAMGGISDAFAIAQIKLTEGTGATALITDQDFTMPDDDESATEGLVVFTDTIGNFDLFNLEVGSSKPLSGTEIMPGMEMNLLTVSSVAGTLIYEFTDTDFSAENINCLSVGGGATEGALTYSVWIDTANQPFGKEILLFTTTQDAIGDIDANAAFSASPGGTYSITMVSEMEHFADADTSSFGIVTSCEPGGGTEIFKTSDCPEEFGIYSPEAVQCTFTITYTNTDSNSPPVRILDTLHAEFQVVGTNASIGDVTLFQIINSGTTIQWDLPAGTTSATLIVDIETVQNPGKGHGKKNGDVFKPTSCGPLPINDGATAFELDPITGEIVLDINLEPVVILGQSNAIIRQAVEGTKICEVPKTIQGLTITQGASGVLILDWDDNGDAALTGYNIYIDVDCTDAFAPEASTDAFTSTYTDSGLTSGIEYCYIVTAVNPVGESTDSKKVPQEISAFAP